MTPTARTNASPHDPRTNWTASRGRALRKRFKSVPFPNWLGLRIAGLRVGEADMSLRIQRKHRQYQGIAHGGALASLADTAATFAALTSLPDDLDVVTIEFKVNFLATIQSGTAVAKGRVVRLGSRVAVADVEIYGPTRNRLAVTGTFTMLVFPRKNGGAK